MGARRLADATDLYRGAFLRGLRPDPALTVTEWAREHRYLSSKGSAEPGRYRPERTPYWVEVLDALSKDSPVQEIVVMKGAQIGFSEAGLTWVGYVMHHAPAPMMLVQPTVDLAERFSKQRVAPMIEVSPALAAAVKDPRSRDSGNTLLVKEFAGGFLVMVGANSAAGLRSTPIKNLMLDEEDAYPGDVEGEGSPAELAKKRTATFPRRKILRGTTPTRKGESAIDAAFAETDQRYYHVPCPHCSHMQVLKWKRVRWDRHPDGSPDLATVRHECEACGEGARNYHKTAMLAAGRWIATAPDTSGGKRRGYHVSALYSPVGWYSWEEAVADWQKALKDPAKLRPFINTVLGEPYEVKGEDAPDWERLYERRENYPTGVVPLGGCLLTAATDVQGDRLETTVVAWNRKRSWIVDHIVTVGDPSTDAPWKVVSDLIDRDWPHASGSTLKIKIMMIDSGFKTTDVYQFCRGQDGRRVYAIKGQENLTVPVGPPKIIDFTYQGKRVRRGVRLWQVGTDMLKGDLYARLKLRRPTDEELAAGASLPAGFISFPMLADDYFRQLTAEQLILEKVRNGFPRYKWVKTYARNEALDLACYTLAAWYAAGGHRMSESQWAALEAAVGARAELPPAAPESGGAPVASVQATGTEAVSPPSRPQVKPKPRPRPRSSFW
jgi:phage terminase large subunit GpA-like protein